MSKQRILLVDDHEVVRLGLKSLLDRHPQFEVVGEAGTSKEALEKVSRLLPDVVLMDIGYPVHPELKRVKKLHECIRI